MADRFPFRQAVRGDDLSLRPLLPVRLGLDGQSVHAEALLDTGATVNVLPFNLGLELGADWNAQPGPLVLGGNLGQYEARALLLDVHVGQLGTVALAFAWTRAEAAPLIFGQVNFFAEFDVCFYRSRQFFEVRRAGSLHGLA
jgi:hypothetical protein